MIDKNKSYLRVLTSKSMIDKNKSYYKSIFAVVIIIRFEIKHFLFHKRQLGACKEKSQKKNYDDRQNCV